jgi:hypothetical protein
VTDEELVARVREGLEYNLHWLEAYYGIVEQDAEAKTNRRLSLVSLEALDTLARRLEELKEGLEAIVSDDEGRLYSDGAGPGDQHQALARSLLHPERQGGEGLHDTTHIKHSHPGEIVPQKLEES